MVLETAGGKTVAQALDAMAPFGRIIFIGQSSGKTALIDPWQLTVPNHTVTSFCVGGYRAFPDLMKSTLKGLSASLPREAERVDMRYHTSGQIY